MDISALRFTPRFLWNGYDQGEVDRFLALAAASLALPLAERPMRPEQAAGVRFTVVRFHPGYHVKQVDRALAELGMALGQPSPSESPESPESPQSPPSPESPQSPPSPESPQSPPSPESPQNS